MGKNYIKEVAALLDLELNEEFTLTYDAIVDSEATAYAFYITSSTYRFTNRGLERLDVKDEWILCDLLDSIIRGDCSVHKVEALVALSKEQKDYLELLLKPFKNDVVSIEIMNDDYLHIKLKTGRYMIVPRMGIPFLYGREYTIEDLKLYV